MMRVTQGMMSSKFMRNINNNMIKMDKLQEQSATTRKINRPSDDPVGLTFAMRYRSEISANEQYKANADSALSWLDNVDSTLGQANEVLAKVRELTVNASNSTNPADAMGAISSELEQLYTQLVEIGNKQFNGKYVFNGQLTDVPPYNAATAGAANPNADPINTDIGVGVRVAVNVSGQDVFGKSTDSDNAFQVVQNIINLVNTNDYANVSAQIDILDGRITKLLQARTDTGAKSNRVELAYNRLEDMTVNLTALQAKVEDADMTEVYTNLKVAESVYSSSLSVGARILQPSLVDFLK